MTDDAEPPPGRPARAVLKLGGEVIADRGALVQVLSEAAELIAQGWRFVIVHGGGPQAGALQQRLGLVPRKVAGQRVTDEATLAVIKQAVAGELNIDLVAHALGVGIDAIGLSGVGARLVEARRRPAVEVQQAGAQAVDYGHVGDVAEVRTDVIETLWAAGLTPVVSPLSVDPDRGGTPASTTSTRIRGVVHGGSLAADHLFLVTSTPGVLKRPDDPTTRIPQLSAAAAQRAVAERNDQRRDDSQGSRGPAAATRRDPDRPYSRPRPGGASPRRPESRAGGAPLCSIARRQAGRCATPPTSDTVRRRPMNDADTLAVLTILLCLGGSMFFSGSETAITSMGEHQARKLLEEGGRDGRIVKNWVHQPVRVLSTILVGNNLTNTLLASVATALTTRHLAPQRVRGLGGSDRGVRVDRGLAGVRRDPPQSGREALRPTIRFCPLWRFSTGWGAPWRPSPTC